MMYCLSTLLIYTAILLFRLPDLTQSLTDPGLKTDEQQGNLSEILTTMMAILPPTSPTTVMGGFSLAIITAEGGEGYCWD